MHVVEPKQRGEKRLQVRWRSKVPRLAMAFHAPEIAHDDSYALQVLGLILTEGKASRLYQRLVEREQSVTFVTAEYGESKDPPLFHVRAEARSGHTAEEIEATLYDEMNRVVKDSVTHAELERAKHQVEAHFVLSRERTLDQAMLLGQIESLYGLDYIDTYVDRVARVTAADVSSVCAKYLAEDNRTVGYLLPDNAHGTADDDDEGDSDEGV
jgi:predicted Zn-dependent peptidase